MRYIFGFILCLTLSACKSDSPTFTWSGNMDPNLKPVLDPNAPTVGHLTNKGYLIVDGYEVGLSCGPNCDGDGFSAVYLGSKGDLTGDKRLADYACPGTAEDFEKWRCRALIPPYVPNGGLRLKTVSLDHPSRSGEVQN